MVTDELRAGWWQYSLIGVGMVMLIVGAVITTGESRGDELVITTSLPEPSGNPEQVMVVVDIQGAVMKPGVYKLPGGSRLVEGILAAEGLSARADKVFVAQHLNQAEVIRDGMKIYIPVIGEVAAAADMTSTISGGAWGEASGTSTAGQGRVSINGASESELNGLWGIGPARAQAIIENRPYASLEELMSKAKIPTNVFEHNRDQLSL
jgi:competence protein ComEA